MSQGVQRRVPGSVVLAASMPKSFARIVLNDREAESVHAAELRLRAREFPGVVTILKGDANQSAASLAAAIPNGSLGIAFIDPYSLDVHFRTIARLAATHALDLIVLFSDAIDIVRNVEEYYYPRKSDKLDLFLGETSNWRRHWDAMSVREAPAVRQLFADIYVEQLGRLGYSHCKTWQLDGPKGPVYRLVYATKHPLGLKYCEIALAEDFDGNLGLFGAM